MKKPDINIEPMIIPTIEESDILETIQKTMQVIKKQEVRKVEAKPFVIIKDILFHFGKKDILLQCLLGITILVILWLMLESDFQSFGLAFLITGGLGMSICISSENLRSRIYQMWELEQACPYSPSKILIWKSTLLSVISTIVMGIGAWMLQDHVQFSLLTLLAGGCIPFFLMNALCLQFQKYIESMNVLLMIYISGFALFVLFSSFGGGQFLFTPQAIWGLLIVIGYFVFNLWHQRSMVHSL